MAYKAIVTLQQVGIPGDVGGGHFPAAASCLVCVIDNDNEGVQVASGDYAGSYNLSLSLPWNYTTTNSSLKTAIESAVNTAYDVSIASFVYPALNIGLL